MKKRVALVCILVACLCAAQETRSEKRIHRIYVDELHFPNNPDWDGFVRSKLISSLAQDCASNCAVVEAVGPTGDNGADTADGVLTGTMLVESPDNRHYRVQGAMRLVDRDGTVLWAATIYSSPLARSATSSFADNTAKKLTAFLAQARGK
jgi:hypothetical protein